MMRRGHTLSADERGLIGKILIVWILLGVLLLVAAIDTTQILITRFRVADAAQTAAFEAAATLKTSKGDREAAYQAAIDAVSETDEGAKLTQFVIHPETGEVTVTVTKRASTLVAGRIAFTKHLTKAKTTETAGPPTL